MNELTVFWDEGERVSVGNELTRLFALQDKAFSQDKRAIFIDELANMNIAAGAVIQGIRSLVHEDLKTIKIGMLMSAARGYVQHEPNGVACPGCSDGIVTMRDEKGYRFALGCLCARGAQRAKSARLAIWNGLETQYRKGRTLTVIPQIQFDFPVAS